MGVCSASVNSPTPGGEEAFYGGTSLNGRGTADLSLWEVRLDLYYPPQSVIVPIASQGMVGG